MSEEESILLRPPRLEDGMDVYLLINICPPLDINSSYCNLLQCSHFADTSVVAERSGEIVGFISGHLKPQSPETLFIWQVAVAPQARGIGLAFQMLEHILARPQCHTVNHLETTITKDNRPSWGLFKRLAQKHQAELQSSVWMDKDTHFAGQHDSEHLVRIGPFNHTSNSGEIQ